MFKIELTNKKQNLVSFNFHLLRNKIICSLLLISYRSMSTTKIIRKLEEKKRKWMYPGVHQAKQDTAPIDKYPIHSLDEYFLNKTVTDLFSVTMIRKCDF